MGPTEVACGAHQSGDSGEVAAAAGEVMPPAAVFLGLWGPHKKSQKCSESGTLKFSWGATIV